MKFGVVSEAQVNLGMSYGVRLRETIKELVFAEEMGFDFIGTSEQHFMEGQWSISAPEVIMPILADRTNSIKIRQMAITCLGFNHPLRVAERVATMDILSNGRFEFATARSNNEKYMRGFGVDPEKTRDEWREHIEVVIRALAQDEITYHGDYYDIDGVSVTPRLESQELPPIYATATSPETHYLAGKMGLGVMTADSYLGWEYQQMVIDEYKRGLKEAEPIDNLYPVNPHITGFTFPAYCAATKEQAFDDAAVSMRAMLKSVEDLAAGLAGTKAPGYQYWQKLYENIRDRSDDLQYLNDTTPMLMVGDPDFFIERCERLEAMGIDEVVLKIDGYGHSKTLKTIELIGKYVIPHFKARKGSIPENSFTRVGIEGVGKFEL
ncbi:LLM class flavin-dependent oxidoreductase [Gordonia desulfuricans]|uniref:LLM class flavin-dependent oxidoreductase n=1 Tax=Gordonia desulfuricans TaxID=89051 RepID=A0A7K3LU95_9ACTN|nr:MULTISPECIES: LLM class flavin-dependent oxidoreductase [Gordonia]NDK91157.1 LLM class flavin-dependent oxidoreductase [Gordonia desulfuricans]WLP88652.1 LLM class flavin-dependent oxidoreductase [Gordonia sp. NB41Y]